MHYLTKIAIFTIAPTGTTDKIESHFLHNNRTLEILIELLKSFAQRMIVVAKTVKEDICDPSYLFTNVLFTLADRHHYFLLRDNISFNMV